MLNLKNWKRQFNLKMMIPVELTIQSTFCDYVHDCECMRVAIQNNLKF